MDGRAEYHIRVLEKKRLSDKASPEADDLSFDGSQCLCTLCILETGVHRATSSLQPATLLNPLTGMRDRTPRS